MLLQIGDPRGRARGVGELTGEPGPPLDFGQQIGDVDVWHQSIQVRSEPHGSGVLLERIRRRELEATRDEAHAVAGVDRCLQIAERVLLICLKLRQALVGVHPVCDRT
jgi:hypothetical protein